MKPNSLQARMARLFSRSAPAGTSGHAFAVPRGMTSDIATMDRVFSLMTSVPDPDETLRRVGILRHQLRVVESDDEVCAALDTRREAVLGTPWRLEGGTARWRTELEAELAPHMQPLLRGCFAAVPYGFSVVEVVYADRGAGRAGIAALAEKPMEWFVPQGDGFSVKFKGPEGMLEGVPVDPRKFLLTVRQGSVRNPYGESLLARAYWPWYFRTHGWQYWMRWLERFGTPLLLGKTAGDPQMLAENMAAALDGAAIAVGQGDDVTAVQVGAGTTHFSDFDNVICRRFQKLILGQTLTTDASKGGSFAAAQVADGVRTDRWTADIRMVGQTVQRLVDALWQFNGRAGPAPKFVMADDTGLEQERATRDAILVEKVGVRLTPKYIAQSYDLEPGDFTMADLDAQPVPGTLLQQESNLDSEPAATFSTSKRQFTPVQQGIEDDLAALDVPDPIAPALVRAAVLAARDEDDLRARLAMLVKETDPRFSVALERASFAAAVLGYVAAEERQA